MQGHFSAIFAGAAVILMIKTLLGSSSCAKTAGFVLGILFMAVLLEPLGLWLQQKGWN